MDVRKLLKNILPSPEVILPPWIAFPDLESGDMFWRMGIGENYMFQWAKYYHDCDVISYQNTFPPPEAWSDFYE